MTTGTIAVCTRDRAAVLPQCLASLDSLLGGPDVLEVLVVDNGSTDSTAGLLRRWRDGGEGRRVVSEPRVGLSRARNAALAASDRDVVLFLDDDALAPVTWARAHLAAYAAAPDVGSVGGPIGVVWPAGRPAWIGPAVMCWYSALDLGDEAGPFPTEHGPYGTNMSVRRAAALAVGGYDPRLGRRGTKLLSSEEPDLTRRLRAAGWVIRYEPEAAVVQQVLPERLEKRWLMRRGWAQGLSNARRDVLGERPSRRERLRRAVEEARESREALAERRGADPEDLDPTIRALAHASAALELARSSLVRRP
jgi:glycosyltransferase involved in cell wall biosynthesis